MCRNARGQLRSRSFRAKKQRATHAKKRRRRRRGGLDRVQAFCVEIPSSRRSRRRTRKKTSKEPASLERLMVSTDQGVARPISSRNTRLSSGAPSRLEIRIRWEKGLRVKVKQRPIREFAHGKGRRAGQSQLGRGHIPTRHAARQHGPEHMMAHAALGEIPHHKNKTHDQRNRRPKVAVGQGNQRSDGKGVIDADNQRHIGEERKHGAQNRHCAQCRQDRRPFSAGLAAF